MWLMSKSPTRLRTAWCSSTIDVYWTGIDQPPNSTSRPPWAWCQSCRAVWSGASSLIAILDGRPDRHGTRFYPPAHASATTGSMPPASPPRSPDVFPTASDYNLRRPPGERPVAGGSDPGRTAQSGFSEFLIIAGLIFVNGFFVAAESPSMTTRALMTTTSIISYHFIGVIEVAQKSVGVLECIYNDGFW